MLAWCFWCCFVCGSLQMQHTKVRMSPFFNEIDVKDSFSVLEYIGTTSGMYGEWEADDPQTNGLFFLARGAYSASYMTFVIGMTTPVLSGDNEFSTGPSTARPHTQRTLRVRFKPPINLKWKLCFVISDARIEQHKVQPGNKGRRVLPYPQTQAFFSFISFYFMATAGFSICDSASGFSYMCIPFVIVPL
jgi:hypothetical protein